MATRIYYKHKRVESADIPYSFKCESCMKDSGELKAHVVGSEAIYNSNFKTINDDRARKLEQEAHENLVKAVKKVHQNAVEKEIYCTEFKDKCPHCDQPQSWGVSGLKNDRFNTPIVILILGALIAGIAVIGHFYDTKNADLFTWPVVFGIVGVTVVAAAASFAWNMFKISQKTKATSQNGARNTPKIEWQKVQKLLDESNK